MSELVEKSTLTFLLADDGSQHAQAAIQLLCDLPLQPGTEIIAVSVFTPLQASDHESLKQSLERTKSCLIDRGLNVTSNFVLGYPAEILIDNAESLNPDLIVMGAKGLRATLGILLGGVAQQVVEYGKWPVLIVRAPYNPLQRILLATDGSEFSQWALDYLVDFPLPENVEIHAIHVLPPAPEPWQIIYSWPPAPEIIQPPLPPRTEEINQMLADQEKQGKIILDQTEQRLNKCQKSVITVLKRGDAATEIIDYIKTNNIQLVVLGSRGLSQMKSWLLGSVSRKIIHYSNCSVLVVKK